MAITTAAVARFVRSATAGRWLKTLASLWLTLAGLISLTTAVLLAYWGGLAPTAALALPFGLLTLNLLAAIFSNPKFQRQIPLMCFHLALLGVMLLLAAGRLSYLNGQVELVTGGAFEGRLQQSESGFWHRGDLNNVRFSNQGFTIDYGLSGKLINTYNKVSWTNRDGELQQAVIGDDHPLILAGYRFYTTSNKGFAPLFAWYPADRGQPQAGAVHLKPYPAFSLDQAQQWTIPGTDQSLWIMLEFDEKILDPEQPSRFRIPEQHHIIVRRGQEGTERHLLRTGDHIKLPGGTLTYGGLRMWMGYKVIYDWTLPWLAAAGFLASLSLLWFYWQKFNRGSWLSPADKHIQPPSSESNSA